MSLSKCFPDSVKPHPTHPLCQQSFFKLLEKSNILTNESGWEPVYFYQDDAAVLPSFIKSHSYGEYIFDWAWANFYHHHQVPYYPKLLHALPFSPVNAPKVWGANQQAYGELIDESYDFYQMNQDITGEHYLFTDSKLNTHLENRSFHIMKTIQYHWHNDWQSFEDFVQSLKKNRRKMIQKERKKIASYSLSYEWLNANQLSPKTMDEVFKLYLTTIDKKNALAYLNQHFFQKLPLFMHENLRVLCARKEGQIIAMALFFEGTDALYGRYWGIAPQWEEKYRLLHFELCYYRAMEYCCQKGIRLFEAGAQGEHKLWRGFKPTVITSAHHIKHPHFATAIYRYIEQFNQETQKQISWLSQHLPYR